MASDRAESLRLTFFRSRLAAALTAGLLAQNLGAATPAGAQQCPPPQGTVLIPLEDDGAPAIDLLHEGRRLDRDEAVDLQRAGVDLSKLEPVTNDFWRGGRLAAEDAAPWNYPAEGAELAWDSEMASPKGILRMRVNAPGADGGERTYQLVLSLNIHAWMMRAALMRKLGYPVPSPRWYPRVTLRFPDRARWARFADDLTEGAAASYTRWIVAQDEAALTITLQDALLEPAQIEYPPFHWGRMSCDRIEGRRTMRALVVPMALADLPESVNLFGWELGKIFDERVLLLGETFGYFAETTIDDLRWIARRAAGLTREDWSEVVAAGRLPEDVGALVLEKLVARRNHLLELTGLKREFPRLPFRSRFDRGGVKGGKLLPRVYPGYAVHFSFRDPGDPMSLKEIMRLASLEGTAAGLRRAAGELSKYLQVANLDPAIRRREEMYTRLAFEHFRKNPGVPFQRPVRVWGGPLAGGGVQFSRNVITGDYYGGEAKLQLVDVVGVTASVGWFAGVSGFPRVLPSATGNLAVTRNYVHVRPLECRSREVDPENPASRRQELSCLEQVAPDLNRTWDRVKSHRDLLVPDLMRRLSQDLDRESAETPSLDAMLGKLRDGEMFIVTDSIAAGVRGNVTVPIPLLTNVDFLGIERQVAPVVSLGGGPTYGVLRRTTFTRTRTRDGGDRLQVYVQSVDSRTLDMAVDFQWFVNAIRLSRTIKDAQAVTQAYLLDVPRTADAEARPRRTRLAVALQAVLERNDVEPLAEQFPHYRLQHESKSRFDRAKLLLWRRNTLEETHRVRVRPPADATREGYDPARFERTLLSHRIVSTLGRNYYGFLSDLINFAAPGWGPAAAGGDNPVNTPFGAASWRSVGAEAEVTPGRETGPVAVLEHHWGGWSIEKKDLFRLFDRIETRLRPLTLDRPILRREEFNATKSIKLYQVVSTLVLPEPSLARVGDLFARAVPIEQVYTAMIDLEGAEAFGRFCRDRGRPVAAGVGLEAPFGAPYVWTGREADGRRSAALCVRPWMGEVLTLRAKAPRADADTKARLVWHVKLLRALDANVDLTPVLAWLGPRSFFLRLQVQGFRTGDENGDLEYVADSIGTIDEAGGDGVYRRFAERYGISSHEVYGRYLSEGF